MPIIGNVGRRSVRVKLLNITIHVLLLLGAVSMIYPFMIMISGSFKSQYDFKNFNIIPKFFYDETTLFHKHLITKYNNSVSAVFYNLKDPCGLIERVTKPEFPSGRLVDDYTAFVSNPPPEINRFYYGVGLVSESGVYPLMLREFRHWLKKQYGSGSEGIEAVNRDLGCDYQSWDQVGASPKIYFGRATGDLNKYQLKCLEFKKETPVWTRIFFDIDGYFIEILRRDVARDLAGINAALNTDYPSWEAVTLPYTCPRDNPALAAVWERFVHNDLNLAFIQVDDKALPTYHSFLIGRYEDVEALNKAYGSDYQRLDEVPLPEGIMDSGPRRVDWNDFVTEAVPVEAVRLTGFGYYYRDYLRRKYHSLAELNQAYGRGYGDFGQIDLPTTSPSGNSRLKEDWNEFVAQLNPGVIGLSRRSAAKYRSFLAGIYREDGAETDFRRMSADYKRRISSLDEIPVHRAAGDTETEAAAANYAKAVKSPGFATALVLSPTPETTKAWRRFLTDKYGEITKLNLVYGYLYTDWDTIPVPTKEWEWGVFIERRWFLFREYLWRNYAMVFDTIIVNGRAAFNTLIYCSLAILAALVVNPMAAYALSRYRPPSSYKILLLLMLTMAFPPMVIGIPRFLLMKQMGLLNTFAALILPGMASGYSIFLLKGFFDSLPKELFECATLDGASEWTIFWQLAMTLSKPILAVIALQTFTMAYGNFMLAFIVCQDKKMWTMMVYLYQLQQYASQAVGFASLLVAAIPTFLVFVFCQNLIIRGIVVPTEK